MTKMIIIDAIIFCLLAYGVLMFIGFKKQEGMQREKLSDDE